MEPKNGRCLGNYIEKMDLLVNLPTERKNGGTMGFATVKMARLMKMRTGIRHGGSMVNMCNPKM
jgi:hypothetical protein